jgi:glutathione peroxidase-family protein
MKTFKAASLLFAVLAVSLAASSLAAGSARAQNRRSSPIAIGAQAPSQNVRMRNVDGNQLTIGGVRGERGTLVVFTCNHCPYARAWEARLTELGNRFRSRGIGVIAINSNDPAEHEEDGYEEMQARARTLGMQFPYVVDATSNVARSFGATRTPEVFLFNAEMRLVYHGAIDDNAYEADEVQARYLQDALTAIVEGRAIPTPTTRSVGCTIKFRD